MNSLIGFRMSGPMKIHKRKQRVLSIKNCKGSEKVSYYQAAKRKVKKSKD